MISRILVLATLLLLTIKTAFAETIKINEFHAAGTTSSNPDWVEIYNDGADLSLYQLMDAINNKKDLATAVCNSNFCTIDWYNYLNNSGDTIRLVLKTATDSPLDQVIYGSSGDISVPGTGQSAKRIPDSTGNWIVSSILTKGESNNSSTPTPTPSPTPASSPAASPSPVPAASAQLSSFLVSNLPSQINSNQSFNVTITLSLPANPSTAFFLKGAFKKSGGSNYFGLTKVSGSWIKNGEGFLNQYQITTNNSGDWSGNLEIKPDSEDSGFTGSNDYIFKVGRYTSSGSGPTWSNEATIKIISAGSDQGRTLTDISSPTTSPSSSPSNQPKSYDKLIYHNATVAGAEASASTSTSTSTKVAIKNQKQTTPIFWVGLIFIFAGIGSIGYIYLKKNGKIPI